MQGLSSTAMILAAGLGVRMRPLTLQTPKPMLKVGGRTMLDHALDRLVAAGIKRAVVNTHYLAAQIETHLSARRDIGIIISREDELLETGGGIKKALHYFDGQPFIALNADLPCIDGTTPSLVHMAERWNPQNMDVLLLVMPTAKARGFGPQGDFALDADGRAHRADVLPPRPYVQISAQILKPELFAEIPERVFSNNLIWSAAEARGWLYGLVHDGTCYHVGTPEDLRLANELLANGQGWGVA